MLVADSLTTLFFPFTWVKPYVPIVPSSNLHFIEAPVPYIMGFYNPEIDKDYFKQGQRCFVDIDSGTVTCPEGVPEFPDKPQLIKEINEILVYFANSYKASLKLANNNASIMNYNYRKQKCKKRVNDLNEIIHKKNYQARGKLTKEQGFEDENDNDDGIDEGECDTDVVIGEDDDEDDVYDETDEYKISNNESSEDIYKDEHEDEEDDDRFILQKSQAFVRIAELALKAGAINNNDHDDYLVDSTVDRTKTNRKKSSVQFKKNNKNFLTTAGVESASSSSSSSSGISIDRNNTKTSNGIATTGRSLASLTLKENSELPFSSDETIKMQFSYAIRELFLQHFVHIFSQYENFVMRPSSEYKSINDWYKNREFMDNFDSKMFLIEQPSPYLPFLSHFLTTQMFVSYIDLKIESFYQQADPTVTVSYF